MEFPAPWPLHTPMPPPATTLNNDLCASRFQLFVYTTTTTTLAEPSFFVFLCCWCCVFLWAAVVYGGYLNTEREKGLLLLHYCTSNDGESLLVCMLLSWHGTRCNRNRNRNGERVSRRKKAFHGQKCTADKFPFADYFILLFWHKVIIPEAKY